MKQSMINTIRNSFHFTIGFTALLSICNYGESYLWQTPFIATILLCLFVGTLTGIGWEYVMGFIFKSNVDITDIILTTSGALLGGFTSFYFHDVKTIQNLSLCVSGVILLCEAIRVIKIKK